jgi:hypothetical protein
MLTVKNQTRGWNKGDKNELEKPKKRRIRVYYYTGEFHHFSLLHLSSIRPDPATFSNRFAEI